MANGNVARLAPCIPEIPALEPFDERLGGAEGWIGAIIIELVDVTINAVREIEAGGLGSATRSSGSDLITGLVVIRGKLGEREFAAAVHRVGRTRRGTPLSAAVKDDIIEAITEVATQVAAMN